MSPTAQRQPLVTPALLRLLSLGVGILVLANILNYCLGAPFWPVTQLIYLGSDNNIPAWYSSGLLAIASVVAYDCFRIARVKETAGAWMFALIAATLLFMSCDEIARIHEISGNYLAKRSGVSSQTFAQHSGWVWIGGPFILGLFTVLFLLLRKPMSLVRGSGRLLGLGLALIVFGGVVLETTINWLNHDELQWLWNVEVVTEEALEMLGSLLLAYAFVVWRSAMDSRAAVQS